MTNKERLMEAVDDAVRELQEQRSRTREAEDKRREAAVEAMRAGVDRQELAERSGFSVAYLRELAASAGVPPRRAGRPRKPETEEGTRQ